MDIATVFDNEKTNKHNVNTICIYKRYPRTRKYLNFILKILQNNHVIIIFISKLILDLIGMWVKLGKKNYIYSTIHF
jgi:hypothetical protein